MNRLQLATLLSWAGKDGMQGRKRLQKVVFFLQEAGCPLECQYTLHHFGPYSRDVADACDEIVAAGLVDEKGGPVAGGQYVYSLKPSTQELLQQTPDVQMGQFQELGTSLIQKSLWHLELGSTILFFYKQVGDWDHALTKACDFKKAQTNVEATQASLALAKQFQGLAFN